MLPGSTVNEVTQAVIDMILSTPRSCSEDSESSLTGLGYKRKVDAAELHVVYSEDEEGEVVMASVDLEKHHTLTNRLIRRVLYVDLFVQYWCDNHISALEASAIVPPA